MFNFHKPRTYRSAEGCCICRAKSSSSRFTDSRKYEKDTMQCFDLKYPRQGEICNACVLLVKRYKRLPIGSKRNWSHVVDAKAGGPGSSKMTSKYKSEKVNSRAAQQITNNGNTQCNTSSENNEPINCVATSINSMSFMSEKYSKIFKKSKKIKDSSLFSSKRKIANNGWSQNTTQSLPTTPDSLDSDYEDTRLHTSIGGVQGGAVVQFQTQTRASAHKAQAAAEARKRVVKLGSKRRKCLSPRKNRHSMIYEESVQFFDDKEWQERKSCCGMIYECSALGGALIIDTEKYKPCEQHQSGSQNQQETLVKNAACNENKATTISLQKTIIQTAPAVVQLQPPQGPSPSTSLSHITNSFKITTASTTTPVLKKHHLFFKRQSECFPQGDIVTTNINNNAITQTHIINSNKTESDYSVLPHQQNQHQHQQKQGGAILKRHIENAIYSSSPANTPVSTNPLNSSALSISVTSSSLTSATLSSSTMPQMPKHSLAKVTTISPPLASSYYHTTTNTMSLAKPNSFLHKMKADTGKIVKHSLEKFNTAVRLKPSDIHEVKSIIKTVDKSYILSKPPTQANIITLNTTTTATASSTYQSLASYNATAQPPLNTASQSAASPTSSTSSTSSTKFSDNSSDSGFDENMLDRKSASPSQEDCEKKLLSRPGLQTMFLASGVQIQGQPQNLVLTGNEVAAKILQNRKYGSITNQNKSNSRSLTPNQPTTTAVKIAQIQTTTLASSTAAGAGGGGGGCTVSITSAAQSKMRAIYNNNNTIQHENGITTIVPASSLAATTQTAAMQNIAPSTVTITPAPPVGTQYNSQNVISRKLTTANIINLQSNSNVSNSKNTNGNQHLNITATVNNNNNSATSVLSAANQKIILLKASPNCTTATAVPAITSSTATTNIMSKYNLQTTAIAGGYAGSCAGGGGGNTR